MGRFKPLLPIEGKSAVVHVVTAFEAAGVGPIVLVTGRDAHRVRDALSGHTVTFVHNRDYAATDMLASVKLGLKAVDGHDGAAFISPGDVPLFLPETPAAMLCALESPPWDVVLPAFAGHTGHPVLISQRVRPHVAGYEGGGGLRGALASFLTRTQILETDDFGILFDMDHPDDYRRIEQLARHRGDGRRILRAKAAVRELDRLGPWPPGPDRNAIIAAYLLGDDGAL